MKKSSIKIQYLSSAPTIHFAHRELIEHPPDGTTFLPVNKSIERSVRRDQATLRTAIRNLASYIPIPTYTKSPRDDADIIYASNSLPITKKPWILDLEMPQALARFHQSTFDNPLFQHILRKKLHSKDCIGITTWSKRAAQVLVDYKLAPIEKIHVINPTTHSTAKPGKFTNKTLLFIGSDFGRKGGPETIAAYELIKRRIPAARLIIVGHVPEHLLPKIQELSIEHHEQVSREKLLNEIYPRSSIFVLPTYQDSYGLVFTEAMSAQLPIVTTPNYASEEIIGGAGILVSSCPNLWYTDRGRFKKGYTNIYDAIDSYRSSGNEQFVNDIAQACIQLLTDQHKYEKLRKSCQRQMDTILSPTTLRTKLHNIIFDALETHKTGEKK